MRKIVIKNSDSGKVVLTMNLPCKSAAGGNNDVIIKRYSPMFLAFMASIVPFIIVCVLHIIYATRFPHQYASGSLAIVLIILTLLCLVPYASVVFFFITMIWLVALIVQTSRSCGGRRWSALSGGSTSPDHHHQQPMPTFTVTSLKQANRLGGGGVRVSTERTNPSSGLYSSSSSSSSRDGGSSLPASFSSRGSLLSSYSSMGTILESGSSESVDSLLSSNSSAYSDFDLSTSLTELSGELNGSVTSSMSVTN